MEMKLKPNLKPSTQRVLDYIINNGSITALEAWRDISVYDLRTRVSELRAAGFPVSGVYEQEKNQYGENIRFKRYRLEDNHE